MSSVRSSTSATSSSSGSSSTTSRSFKITSRLASTSSSSGSSSSSSSVSSATRSESRDDDLDDDVLGDLEVVIGVGVGVKIVLQIHLEGVVVEVVGLDRVDVKGVVVVEVVGDRNFVEIVCHGCLPVVNCRGSIDVSATGQSHFGGPPGCPAEAAGGWARGSLGPSRHSQGLVLAGGKFSTQPRASHRLSQHPPRRQVTYRFRRHSHGASGTGPYPTQTDATRSRHGHRS